MMAGARHPGSYAQPTRHAATDACPDATGGTVALAVVPQRALPAQIADGTRAADHPLGRECFKRRSPAIGTVQTLLQQRCRPSASKRSLKRHHTGVSRTSGRLALRLDRAADTLVMRIFADLRTRSAVLDWAIMSLRRPWPPTSAVSMRNVGDARYFHYVRRDFVASKK